MGEIDVQAVAQAAFALLILAVIIWRTRRQPAPTPVFSRIDPLLVSVFEKLPTRPGYPHAPLPPGEKVQFPDRDQWLESLTSALDLVYGPHQVEDRPEKRKG